MPQYEAIRSHTPIYVQGKGPGIAVHHAFMYVDHVVVVWADNGGRRASHFTIDRRFDQASASMSLVDKGYGPEPVLESQALPPRARIW